MLTRADFPRLPIVDLLENNLPAETNIRAKQRLAIFVALLADTTNGPTTIATLADLTQYSVKRLSSSIDSLLKTSVERDIVTVTTTRENLRAYHIPYRDGFYLSSSNGNLELARNAARALDEVLKDIRRRARGKREEIPQSVPAPVTQTWTRVEADSSDGEHSFAEYRTQPPSQDESEATLSLPPVPDLHSETQEVLKRFREITRKYHEAVVTKKHLESLQVHDVATQNGQSQGHQLDNLRREIMSEAHESLQTMVLEASQLMADTLDATLCAISSPCGVCFDTMRGPQVFPGCGHAFCEKCVFRLPWVQMPWSHDLGKECPMCRNPSPPLTLYL